MIDDRRSSEQQWALLWFAFSLGFVVAIVLIAFGLLPHPSFQ